MSATHLHLLLNHFPTVGFIIGFGLFVIGLAAKSDHLKVASLVVMVVISLVTIPVFVTGGEAAQALCSEANVPGPCPDEGVSRTLIEMHEGAALWSLLLMVLTGAFAWLGLWHHRRLSKIPTTNVLAILILSVVTVAASARAANLGGEIRHPEIRVGQESSEQQFGRAVSHFAAVTPWVLIAAETLHFIGLTLLLGVVLLIDAKVLGYLPLITYAALDRLLPWAILGFGLNALTGIVFFVATPHQYVGNVAFHWKLAFLICAGANTLWFTFDPAWEKEGHAAPLHSKVLAGTALVLWVGVMFWGRMLPFIGQAF
jgi:uncharacterized membrane protein